MRIKPDEVPRFRDECTLLRGHLDAICDGVDLSGQHGLTVNMVSGQVISPRASREAFRELVTLHLANIEDAAQRASQARGQVEIW